MNTKFFRMQPPEIQVQQVCQEDLKDFLSLMQTHEHFFPNYKRELKSDQRLKIQGNQLVSVGVNDKFFSEPPLPLVIVTVGDFYLLSNNGTRFFTSDARVKNGMMFGLPQELFIPVYGSEITVFDGTLV